MSRDTYNQAAGSQRAFKKKKLLFES